MSPTSRALDSRQLRINQQSPEGRGFQTTGKAGAVGSCFGDHCPEGCCLVIAVRSTRGLLQ